jgi:hypothetical protein
MPWPTLRPLLKKALSDFAQDPANSPMEFPIGTTMEVTIIPASSKLDTLFVLGAHTDRQSGGFVLSEMIRNLEICVAEKTTKVAKYKVRYPEWWLILVDHISYGMLDNGEIARLKEFMRRVQQVQCWDKVVIVDSQNCAHSFEL